MRCHIAPLHDQDDQGISHNIYGKLSTLPPLLAALAFGTAAQAADTLQSLVDTTIRPVMAEYDITGMAVAISHNGQAHYFN